MWTNFLGRLNKFIEQKIERKVTSRRNLSYRGVDTGTPAGVGSGGRTFLQSEDSNWHLGDLAGILPGLLNNIIKFGRILWAPAFWCHSRSQGANPADVKACAGELARKWTKGLFCCGAPTPGSKKLARTQNMGGRWQARSHSPPLPQSTGKLITAARERGDAPFYSTLYTAAFYKQWDPAHNFSSRTHGYHFLW